MVCHHFVAPEQSKKTNKRVFWASLEPIENGFTRIYRFFAYFERNKQEMVQLLAKLILV